MATVAPVTMEPPAVQEMNVEDVIEIIVEQELGKAKSRCTNIMRIFGASTCGLLGLPTCCHCCCGCCGRCEAPCMVPTKARDAADKLNPQYRKKLNVLLHTKAGVLAATASTLCMCCGCCGTWGPFTTAAMKEV